MAQWVTVMRADKAAGRSSDNCGVDQPSTWRGGETVAPHALDTAGRTGEDGSVMRPSDAMTSFSVCTTTTTTLTPASPDMTH